MENLANSLNTNVILILKIMIVTYQKVNEFTVVHQPTNAATTTTSENILSKSNMLTAFSSV